MFYRAIDRHLREIPSISNDASLSPVHTTMPRRSAFALLIWLILALFSCLNGVASAIPASDVDRTRLIVRLAPLPMEASKITLGNTGRIQFDEALAENGVSEVKQIFPVLPPAHRLSALAHANHLEDYVVLPVPAGVDPDSLKQRLDSLSDVTSVEFDAVVHTCESTVTPNDLYFLTHQYPLHNTGTQPPADPGTPGADIGMEAAWAYTTGDSNIIIGIVDTGIDWWHPDLAGHLWVNADEVEGDIDTDHNGYPGDIMGWNFPANNYLTYDDNSHGSHVAGIAGAVSNNGVGVAGMNWKCRLMAVKVLNALGSGSAEDVAAGIQYAAANGASVINLSLGSYQSSGVEQAAIDFAVNAGVTVCAAMGNENSGLPHYPSAYPNVIAVGATDSDDRRAHPFCFADTSGSNYGPAIDVCAPGDWVWSTIPTGDGSYGYKCGTSMATPHVAGLAALVKALRPNFTPAQVQDIIQKGAQDQVGRPEEDTPGYDIYHGWGRINARTTLQALAVALPPILFVPGPQIVTELDTLRIAIHAIDSNFTIPTLSASSLANAIFTDSGNGNGSLILVPDINQQGSYQVTFIASDGVLADTDQVSITVSNACLCRKQGNVNGDGVYDVLDVLSMIGSVFVNAPAPPKDADCPPSLHRGDFNCDNTYDVFDVLGLINYVFVNGAPPCNPCLH